MYSFSIIYLHVQTMYSPSYLLSGSVPHVKKCRLPTYPLTHLALTHPLTHLSRTHALTHLSLTHHSLTFHSHAHSLTSHALSGILFLSGFACVIMPPPPSHSLTHPHSPFPTHSVIAFQELYRALPHCLDENFPHRVRTLASELGLKYCIDSADVKRPSTCMNDGDGDGGGDGGGRW